MQEIKHEKIFVGPRPRICNECRDSAKEYIFECKCHTTDHVDRITSNMNE